MQTDTDQRPVPVPVPAPRQDPKLARHLDQILKQSSLTAVFQPIVCMREGKIHGYEGLVRGPADSPLHAPDSLFRVASRSGRLLELEKASRQVVMRSFAALNLPAKLFLNVSPQVLLQPAYRKHKTLDLMKDSGLRPEQVVIELTENHPIADYIILRDAACHYRSQGFEIAMDDLGEGFSSLRMWSELNPDYIKIDKHFILGIGLDAVKQQFVGSIQSIAANTNTRVVAEGIENHTDMMTLWDLGIAFGQGFYLARPDKAPALALPETVGGAMGEQWHPHPRGHRLPQHHLEKRIWRNMVKKPPKLDASDTLAAVHRIFDAHPEATELPVFEDGDAVGLVNRDTVQHLLMPPLGKEIFGQMPCLRYADASPLTVDVEDDLESLCELLASRSKYFVPNGFLVTKHGRYYGVGNIHGLVREITRTRVHEARYANPLTQLPGNVTINEHINHLLNDGVKFCACRCDLNDFKNFNDAFGYRRGDKALLMLARILAQAADGEQDFIGHTGGDDFVLIFRSPDWQLRCKRAISSFSDEIKHLFQEEEIRRGGFEAEGRDGKLAFHAFPSLSMGAAEIDPKRTRRHFEVFRHIAEAHKKAKRKHANTLFVG